MNTQSTPTVRKTVAELEAFIGSFPFWYQRIYLGQDLYTIPGPHQAFHEVVWNTIEPCLPRSLSGARVLDIGTNAGYFALQTKLRNASRVLGIDCVEVFLQQARYIAELWDLEIDYRRADAHKISALGEKFDLVVFAGTFYHLKNPFAVIEDIAKVCTDAVILETEAIPPSPDNVVYCRLGPPGDVAVRPAHSGFMKFIEGTELNGDPSNWWVPDTECVMAMLRASGFTHFSTPLYPSTGRLVLVATKRKESLLTLQNIG